MVQKLPVFYATGLVLLPILVRLFHFIQFSISIVTSGSVSFYYFHIPHLHLPTLIMSYGLHQMYHYIIICHEFIYTVSSMYVKS